MAGAAVDFDKEELLAQGFTIVRGAVPLGACRRACELLDDYLGPRGKSVADHIEAKGWPLCTQYVDNPRVPPPPADQQAFWATAPPFFQSHNYRHDIRHPIHEPVMAELITPAQVDAQKSALGIGGGHGAAQPGLGSLKLMQQFLIRTDYQPPPCESPSCCLLLPAAA